MGQFVGNISLQLANFPAHWPNISFSLPSFEFCLVLQKKMWFFWGCSKPKFLFETLPASAGSEGRRDGQVKPKLVRGTIGTYTVFTDVAHRVMRTQHLRGCGKMGPEQRVFEAGRTETLLQVQSWRKGAQSFQNPPISSHLQHVVLYPLAQFDAGGVKKTFL